MDALTIKVLILGGSALVRFKLAQSATSVEAAALPPAMIPPHAPTDESKPSAVSGSDIPFPFDVRELEAELGPRARRPHVLNYNFRHIDLRQGPSDPESFLDDFYIEFENPKSGHRWTAAYIVGTPEGLEATMDQATDPYVWGGDILFVRRYDLATILRAVLERNSDSGEEEEPLDEETAEN